MFIVTVRFPEGLDDLDFDEIGVNKVDVRYGDKHYDYTYPVNDPSDPLPKTATHAVVESPYTGLTVVEVVKIEPVVTAFGENEFYKPVVSLIDYKRYTGYLAMRDKAKKIEGQLEALVAKHEKATRYSRLLEGSDEAKTLLDEYLKTMGMETPVKEE